MEQNHTPLTKEILTEALLGMEHRLEAKWESKLDAMLDSKLDAKLQRFATKDDLKSFATKDAIRGLQDDVRRVAKSVARLEGDVYDIRHTLKTEYATKLELEPFRQLAERTIKELDLNRELRSTRGALLDDVVEKVEDHERRLRGIEDRH